MCELKFLKDEETQFTVSAEGAYKGRVSHWTWSWEHEMIHSVSVHKMHHLPAFMRAQSEQNLMGGQNETRLGSRDEMKKQIAEVLQREGHWFLCSKPTLIQSRTSWDFEVVSANACPL